jgi:hypothetical protein
MPIPAIMHCIIGDVASVRYRHIHRGGREWSRNHGEGALQDRKWSRRDVLKASAVSPAGARFFAEPLMAAAPPPTAVTSALVDAASPLSATTSQPRSLLSMAKLNIAKSRVRPSTCNFVRIVQTCFRRRGKPSADMVSNHEQLYVSSLVPRAMLMLRLMETLK